MKTECNTAKRTIFRAALALCTVVLALHQTSAGAKTDARKLAEELNDIGVEAMKRGDVKSAALKFEEALAVDKSLLRATHNLGKLLAASGQYEWAKKVLEAGLAQNSDDTGCIVQLVQVSALNEDAAAARKYLNKAAGLSDKRIIRELPILLIRQNSLAIAEEAADMSIAGDPENAVCWFNKGLVLEKLERYDHAADAYSKAVKMDGGYLAAWVNLGNAFDAQGKDEAAVDAYRHAFECDKNNSFAQYNYGRKLVLDGIDVKNGFAMLRQAATGGGGAAESARMLVEKLVDIAQKGGAK